MKLMMIIGSIIAIIGLLQVVRYFLIYNSLSEYGAGYLVGSVSLIVIGAILIIIGKRK